MGVKIICPLIVPVGKKMFSLNLNVYRNAHFRVLAKAKTNYKMLVKTPRGVKYDKVKLIYTLYPKNKRKLDLANVCSVVDKFVSDILVERGMLVDDSLEFVKEIVFKVGGISPKNARVELEIVPIVGVR